MKRVIYVSSPFSGDTAGNAIAARKYCRFAVARGTVPIAPHLLFPQFMDDGNPEERRLAMAMNMRLLERCDALWVFGDRISEGMRQEINAARRRGMPIRYFSKEGESE